MSLLFLFLGKSEKVPGGKTEIRDFRSYKECKKEICK